MQMTMDLYTHVLGDYLNDEMEKLENELDKIEMSSDNLAEARYNQECKRNEEGVSGDNVCNLSSSLHMVG